MRQYVWDLPTRASHWLFALAVTGALITADLGGEWLVWHARFATVALSVLLFRLSWGFWGSYYARFWQFFPTPSRLKRYWQGEWRAAGHSPLGALSAFAMWGFISLQLATGAFASDDTGFRGPWVGQISDGLTRDISHWHHELGEMLVWLIGLHVAAIAFYRWVKGRRLVAAMVHGYSHEPAEPSPVPVRASWVGVLLSLAIAAGGAWAFWNMPEPPTPVVVETPAW